MKKLIIALFLFATIQTLAQQKADTSTFILKGKITDFELMYRAVSSPDDVTPNQKRSVLKFIEGLKPEKDSTSKTKK